MTLSDSFVQEVDHTSQEQWEKFLKAELKLEDVKGKLTKNTPDGKWPTLSLESLATQIPAQTSWKKASQTYVNLRENLELSVADDLANGVRIFFLEKDFIEQDQLRRFFKTLSTFDPASELEVFLLGDKKLSYDKMTFKVVDESELVSGRSAHAPGGNNIQELALMSYDLIQRLGSSAQHFPIGIFVGPHFFRNIAKIRAAKLLATKILQEAKSAKTFSIVALTSFREWTLFERYSNILRNDVSVASAFIAGADHVQSAGYQTLLELEAGSVQDREHSERSLRMARNTSHILALESMLGIVGDAAFGSYHLEGLTQSLCEESWKLMQKIVTMSPSDCSDFMMKETTLVREERRKQINLRKLVMAGTNDFPDARDRLGDGLKMSPRFYRLAQDFETIRIKNEALKNAPKVFVALYGDYAALNARMNFVKNYFELLGLEVTEPGHALSDKKLFAESLKHHENDILILCSSDDLYPELVEVLSHVTAREKFIAGKFELPGFTNIFVGQDVYAVLSGLVAKWSGK